MVSYTFGFCIDIWANIDFSSLFSGFLGHCQIVEKRVLSQINEKIVFFMEIFALKVMFFPFFLLTLYAICTRVPMLNLLLAGEKGLRACQTEKIKTIIKTKSN